MGDLIYTQIGSRASAGPLVQDLDVPTLGYLAATNPAQLAAYMNAQLTAAEQALPEGARVEISISGWWFAGSSWAQRAADNLQQSWMQGQLIDPDTGAPIEAWPEYPGQIAWGDNYSDTLTLRTVKRAIPVVVYWIVIALLAAVAIYEIWQHLKESNWVASTAAAPGQLPGPTPPGAVSPTTILVWLGKNWAWVVLGAGALAAAPFVVKQVAKLREAGNELAAASEGEY